jgi:hypothetical protein
MPSFDNKKQLRFVITLGSDNPKFDEAGSDQIVLQGYRATVICENAGWVQMGELRAEIFGTSQSDMNFVTSYPLRITEATRNKIVVYAIDGKQESVVFAGNMVKAWPDYSRMPDVCLRIQAQAAYSDALKTVAPRSFKGGCDVADVMRKIATSMGLVFENSGVNVKLADVYLANTNLEQARDLARSAGVELNIEGNVLSIWPKGSYRNALVPLVSADTGLVGYPSFDGTYLRFDTLYNPNFITGGLIKVESENLAAKGQWQILKMGHRLESEKPGGAWFSSVVGVSLNYYVQNI